MLALGALGALGAARAKSAASSVTERTPSFLIPLVRKTETVPADRPSV
jgi:hypothetical protein